MKLRPYRAESFEGLSLQEQNELLGYELLRQAEEAYIMGFGNADK